MPYRIINELRDLVQISKRVQVKQDPQKNLSDPYSKCPNQVNEKVDLIEKMCLELFGVNREPDPFQKRAMEQAGFSVCAGGEDIVGWTEGVILTPVGQIRY